MFINLNTNDIYRVRGINIKIKNKKGEDVTVPDRVLSRWENPRFKEEFNILPLIDKGKKDDRFYINSEKKTTISTKKNGVIRTFSPVPRFKIEELREQVIDREVMVLANKARNQENENLKLIILSKPPVDLLKDLQKEMKKKLKIIKSLSYDELAEYD